MAAYYTRAAWIELQAGRPSEAVRPLETARRWDPWYGRAHFFRGEALRLVGQTEEAIRAYAEALRHHPNDFAALNSMGFLHRQAGRAMEALEMYEKALAMK